MNQSQAAVLPASLIQQGVSPTQIVAILLAYTRWIILVTFVVTVATILVSKFLIKRSYEATATLQFDFQVYDPVTGREFPSFLQQSYMTTQLDILQGRRTLLKVVEELGWAQDSERTAGYEAGSSGSIQDYLATQLSKSLSVGHGRDSRLVQVSFEADSAAEAARVANTVAEVYLQEQLATVTEPTRQRAGDYSEQLDSMRQEVAEAQSKLSDFRQKHGLLDFNQRADVETEKLNELSRRLVEAEAVSSAASLKLQQIGKLRAGRGDLGSETEVLASGFVQDLKRELAVLEARRSELSETLGRRHPDLIALDAQIDETRRRLDRELNILVGNIRNEAELAAERAAALRQKLEAQRARVLETQRLADEGANYQRALQSAETLHSAALNRYDELVLSSNSRYSNVSIISPATPPLKHSSPQVRVNAILGLFFGGFIGVATAILAELRRRRVRCRDDIERDLGIPVLAELGGSR